MKLILSRKGFDSSSGGVPSPIFPDGKMLSLPIPSRDEITYGDIRWDGEIGVGEIVDQLTSGNIAAEHGVHLDPDLRREALPRLRGWRPMFGQAGVAQGHLGNQHVGPATFSCSSASFGMSN